MCTAAPTTAHTKAKKGPGNGTPTALTEYVGCCRSRNPSKGRAFSSSCSNSNSCSKARVTSLAVETTTAAAARNHSKMPWVTVPACAIQIRKNLPSRDSVRRLQDRKPLRISCSSCSAAGELVAAAALAIAARAVCGMFHSTEAATVFPAPVGSF